MRHAFNTASEYGGRQEYQQNDEFELEECGVVTDLIDEILLMKGESGSDIPTTVVSNNENFYLSRSYRYIEGDVQYGWSWPLVEKSVDISYIKSKKGLSSETYRVAVGNTVHQVGASEEPILTVYTVNYIGKDRSNVQTTIESQNIIGGKGESDDEFSGIACEEGEFIERKMNAYDRAAAFDDLTSLINMQIAQNSENNNIQ